MTAPTPALAGRPGMMTEAQIQAGLRDALERLGYLVYHTTFAIRSDKGFPDLVGVRPDGKLVAIECKGPKGRIGPMQQEWIDRFRCISGCIFAEIVTSQRSLWFGYDEAISEIQRRTEVTG